MDQEQQKIVQEYFLLVEKSQQLFAGLRDLPQFGKHWQPYFQRTFEIYTKLWKFQQQHRAILENKEIYGLKRWEIGEIASKIGQLYYHYYLRTSETNYIEEAYVFYEAIRQRDYFKSVFETKNSLLVVKKLRYYARFIVVSLLLNRRKLVSALVDELQVLVDAYIKTFKPGDAAAWRLVLQEINLFLQVDRPLVLLDKSKDAPPISNRLNLPPSTLEGKPKLQEAILVGNCQNQVKFSELTLDMFRIMQVLEREQGIVSRLPEPEDLEGSAHKPVNPHKFLLYRPSFSQLYVFLSTAFKELSDNNVLLLYLSADSLSGDIHNDESKEKDKDKQALGDVVYRKGGLAMSSTVLSSSPDSLEEPEQAPESPYGLYPEDLVPFTRKKMFVIVESGNSLAFKSIQNVFGKPFLFLLSPTRREYGGEQRGNLFTLFLSAPLSAFCFMVGKTSVPQDTYEKCEKSLSNSFEDVHKLLCNFESIPPAFHDFIEEDFLQSFILRFIFCYSVLYLHKSYQSKAAESLPQSHPMLPMDFLSHPVVLSIVYKLASFLQVTDQFGQP